jgi:hypothetical protein
MRNDGFLADRRDSYGGLWTCDGNFPIANVSEVRCNDSEFLKKVPRITVNELRQVESRAVCVRSDSDASGPRAGEASSSIISCNGL